MKKKKHKQTGDITVKRTDFKKQNKYQQPTCFSEVHDLH